MDGNRVGALRKHSIVRISASFARALLRRGGGALRENRIPSLSQTFKILEIEESEAERVEAIKNRFSHGARPNRGMAHLCRQ